MVLLQTRWKEKRRWNGKRWGLLALRSAIVAAVGGAVLGALVVTVKFIPALLRSTTPSGVSAGNLPARAAGSSSAANDSSATDRNLIDRLDRKFTVSGYTFVLPKGFQSDVLPQPTDLPKSHRFIGLRFRGPAGDAAQLVAIVMDDPDFATDAQALGAETRLTAALDRLFERLTRNSAAVGFARGKDQLGEFEGMPYARAGYSGNFRDSRKRPRIRRQGVALATVEDGRELYFYFFCEPTADRETYQLLETSLSTLRRVEARRAGADDAPQSDP